MTSPMLSTPESVVPSRGCWPAGRRPLAGCSDDDEAPTEPTPDQLAEGKQTFRFDTFGDETFWTDTLRMHEVIQAAVSPQTALAVGLKVDADVAAAGHPGDRGPHRPGDHGRAAQAGRGGRPQGDGARRSTARTP